MELISQQGFASMADAIRIVVNEAMKLQRTESLDAQPHERSDIRRGYANGFKTMTVSTRVGKIQFAAPQVRDTREGERFYPSDL
ncbi:MAG: transposase [Planctomycetota bacterium]